MQAVPLLKRALCLDEVNPSTHASLAVAYEGLAKPDKAKRHYLRALELDPGSARTHLIFGALLWRVEEHNSAIEHYERAIELDPEFSEAYGSLAWAMHFAGRIDEALRCGETAVRLDPSSARGHMNLGQFLQANGSIEDAIRHYLKAIDLDARLAEVYKCYAYARLHPTRHRQAIFCLQPYSHAGSQQKSVHCSYYHKNHRSLLPFTLEKQLTPHYAFWVRSRRK